MQFYARRITALLQNHPWAGTVGTAILCQVTDALIRAQADAMVQNGMKALGYEYVNIDDCWQGERDAQGVIHGDKNFPDMKALADYIHSKGLKFGLYSSPGPTDLRPPRRQLRP